MRATSTVYKQERIKSIKQARLVLFLHYELYRNQDIALYIVMKMAKEIKVLAFTTLLSTKEVRNGNIFLKGVNLKSRFVFWNGYELTLRNPPNRERSPNVPWRL